MSNPINNVNTSALKVIDEKAHWMRFSNSNFVAEDNILSNAITSGGYGYRKVHFTDEVEKNKTLFGFGTDKVFFDDEWDIRKTEDLSRLATKTSGPVVLRRLSHLYPANSNLRPKFFPDNDLNEPLRKVEDLTIVPHFLHEMGLFPVSQFKSLFFTQDFQPSGMYHAVVNYNGRWETDVVDDFIPVYEKTGKPVWGMDLEQPWQLILAKFLAKRYYCLAKDNKYDMATRGGYTGINTAAPFEFVGFFTNNIWKFVNLNVDYKTFLKSNVGKVHKAHFILKSKNSSHVRDSGLIQNEACYELVNLVEEGVARSASGIKNSTTADSKVGNKKVNYIATIRSSNKTYWAGKKSVLDSDFKNIHKGATTTYKESSKLIEEHTFNDKRNENFGLDRYFTVDGEDLKNLFSSCYISSRRVGSDFVSGFFKFNYPAKRTNAYYLEFNIPEETFLDFSIKQNPRNRIPIKSGSKIEHEKHQQEYGGVGSSGNERFLYNKYMLVKDNSDSNTTPSQVEYEKEYNRLNYETYEIEFLKGYNAGEGHFLRVVKGRYILRLKSEMIDRDAEYVINYASTNEINFKEVIPNKQEETKIMKDALASTIDKVPRTNLIKGIETQVIAYGNTFDYVGYGYIGAKLKKSSKAQILIDVDPKVLKDEGYRLKHLYKKETEPFAIVVNPGEATAVVLKKINDNAVLHWPPRGIAIFQK